MDTTTDTGTTTETAPAPRAENRTLADVVQMNRLSRQPAPEPSATAANGSAPAAPTNGTVTPAPNQATPEAASAATETPLSDAALADAPAGETAPAAPESASAPPPEGAAETPAEPAPLPDGPALSDDETTPLDDAPAEDIAAQVAAALEGKDVPKAIKALTGRLGEVTRKLREAEARNHAVEREELTEAPAKPAANAPAGHEWHPVIRQIDGERAKTLEALSILEAHPDGGAMVYPPGHANEGQPIADEKGSQLNYTAAQVRQFKFNYSQQLAQLNEDRTLARGRLQSEFQQVRQQVVADARELYPWLWDKASPEFKMAKQITDRQPAIKQGVDWEIVIGRHVEGILREQQKRTRPALLPKAPPMKKPASKGAPAPVVTTAAAPAPRVNAAQQQIQEAAGKQYSEKQKAKLLALAREARESAAA